MSQVVLGYPGIMIPGTIPGCPMYISGASGSWNT